MKKLIVILLLVIGLGLLMGNCAEAREGYIIKIVTKERGYDTVYIWLGVTPFSTPTDTANYKIEFSDVDTESIRAAKLALVGTASSAMTAQRKVDILGLLGGSPPLNPVVELTILPLNDPTPPPRGEEEKQLD